MGVMSEKQAASAQEGSDTPQNNSAKSDSTPYYYLAPLLEGFAQKDLTTFITNINTTLNVIGKDLSSLNSSSPVNGNLFASASVSAILLDRLVNPTETKSNDALVIDLLGTLSGDNATTVTVLRPILHKIRDAYLRQGNVSENPLKASDIKLFDDHLHTLNAGSLKLFVQKCQEKLPTWLKQSVLIAQSSLNDLTLPPKPSPTVEKPDMVGSNTSINWYDPQKVYLGLWDALKTVSSSKNALPVEGLSTNGQMNSAFIAQISKLQTTLPKEINAQSGTKEGQIGFYLQSLMEVIKGMPETAKNTTIVEGTPARADEIKKEGIIEALAQVNPTENNPNECNCSGYVGGSIGLALGEEYFEQTDFILIGLMPLLWDRVYRSNLITYDKGPLGARWTNAYLARIDIRQHEWLYNTPDGRITKLPKLKVGEVHREDADGYNMTYLSDELISLTFGSDMLLLFQKQGKNHYKLYWIRDNNQNEVKLSYDKKHRLSLVNNLTNMHCLTFDYNEHNQITKVHLNRSHKKEQRANIFLRTVAEYEYDKKGNLVSAIDDTKDKRTFEYDDYHRVTRYTDRTGFGMNLEWTGRRHKAKAFREYADDGSRELNLSWNNRLRETTFINALGQIFITFNDIDGYPIRNILPDGREQWFFRDSGKNVIKEISPDGRATSSVYDWQGNILSQSQNDSSQTFFEYNDQNQLTKITDANGHAWRKQYDSKGNVLKDFDPKERITLYEYNDKGLPIKVVDPRGGVNTLDYNKSGQLIKQTDCSNQSSEYSYGSKGELLSTKDAKDHSLKYEYNDKGMPSKVIYPDGKFQSFEYDAEGRLLTTKDSLGRVSRTDYDTGFYPFMTTDPLGRQTRVKRDKLGRITQLTDANGANYNWHFHPLTNQLIKETNFAGKTTYYTYDKKTGELSCKQEDGGQQIHFQYDEMGRLVERSSEDGLVERYSYDAMGQLISTQNAYCKNQYFYDEVGNLTKEIQYITRLNETTKELKEIKEVVWQYEYDVLGNRTATIRPDGNRIDYLTYGSGHIHNLLLNTHPLVDYERDEIHRETARQYGNKLEQQYQFDETGYLTHQTLGNQTLSDAFSNKKEFRYNKFGLIGQIHDQYIGSHYYEYDVVGRLTKAQTPSFTEDFKFDPADNLIDPMGSLDKRDDYAGNYDLEGQFRDSITQTDRNKQSHQKPEPNKLLGNLLKEYAGNHYEYDRRGNLIKRIKNGETTLYEWNALNQLTKLTNHHGTHHYRYDTMGRRIYKYQANGVEVFYLWEDDTLAMEDVEGQIRHYVYEPDSFAPLVQFTTRPDHDPHQVYFYHNDHIGTPELMTDQSGKLVWEGVHTAFGETFERVDKGAQLDGLRNPIHFQGQHHDPETGLHYNRFRYYDPETGKYLSEDPIKLAGGMNLYGYPSNPVHGVDPLGLTEPGENLKIAKKWQEIQEREKRERPNKAKNRQQFLGRCYARYLLKHFNGDSGRAWAESKHQRQGSKPGFEEIVKVGADSEIRRNAEHYLYAYDYMAKGGMKEGLEMSLLTNGYNIYKKIRPGSAFKNSPLTGEEIASANAAMIEQDISLDREFGINSDKTQLCNKSKLPLVF